MPSPLSKSGVRLKLVAITCVCAANALPLPALTIHRSFRSREVGFGGGRSVSVPLDARIAAALDEADRVEAERTKVVIGRCTRVLSGNMIRVVTDGNMLFAVRLDRIAAPEPDQPHGKESSDALAKLIRGRNVRVEWVKRDGLGRLLGIVYLPKVEQPNNPNDRTIPRDVNLHLVATGNARLSSAADAPPAYFAAESAAKARRLGLWASLP